MPIKYSVTHGTHAISSKGELIVSRAANVKLACLTEKVASDPIWVRKYKSGLNWLHSSESHFHLPFVSDAVDKGKNWRLR